MRWIATGVVVLGAAGSLAFAATAGTAVGASVYFPLCALGVAAMVVGIRRSRPAAPAGWWCVVASYLVWFAGDAVHVTSLRLHGPSAVSPGAPLYLLAYLPMGTGLVLMARAAGAARRRAALLEGGIVSVALSLLGCLFFIAPALQADGPLGPRLLGATYLCLDIVMVTLGVHLLATTPRRSASHLLGTAGLVVVLVADASWTVIGEGSPLGPVLAMGVLVSNALWAAAALNLHDLHPPVPDGAGALSARRLVVLALALALPTTVWAVLEQTSDAPAGSGPAWTAWALAAAGLLMAVLVVLRMTEALRSARAALRARERMRRELEHQATHDQLTGLADRAHSRERLAAALEAARGTDRAVAVLFVDLDDFKAVNDSLGHRAGDAVLRCVAARISTGLRAGDVVGRLGGDEFVVVLDGIEDEPAAAALAQRLVDRLCEPVEVDGEVVVVGASIGAALTVGGAMAAEALLHEADTAVYRAKAAGRGRVVVHDDALRCELAARAELAAELRTAIAGDELELHYQPVVDLVAGAGGSRRADLVVGGVEALVRWHHPRRGPLGPGLFVPVAEASDLVCELGRWVLRTAARQQAAWAALDPAGRGPIVGVNLAPRHLATSTVVAEVADAVTAAGVAPGRFLVEVTETELIDSGQLLDNLRALRAMGVLVAIDDFGTGWTSIGQLQHLPCDVLKVDRGLVVSTAPGAAELLALIASAGHAFGMVVLAEGVETAEQRAAALAAGADCAQGWLWCPAVRAGELDALVTAGSGLAALEALTAARQPVA